MAGIVVSQWWVLTDQGAEPWSLGLVSVGRETAEKARQWSREGLCKSQSKFRT